MIVMIIHSGRLLDSMKVSISFRRLTIFLRLASELVSTSSTRSVSRSSVSSSAASISRTASAPMPTVKLSSPYSSR